MGELDNYTYSESSDHLDKGKQIFFINFGATSFLRQFSKGSEKNVMQLSILDLMIYPAVNANLFKCFLTKVSFYLELKHLALFSGCHGSCFPIVMATKN